MEMEMEMGTVKLRNIVMVMFVVGFGQAPFGI
jgi:hypothetical protein